MVLPEQTCRPGDWVLCKQGCCGPWFEPFFELPPITGEAFRVTATGLLPPPGFDEEANGVRLHGVLDPDGNEPHFGIPADQFFVCPQIEAEPGWRDYLRRLDRHRLTQFYKLVNAGVAFESLPPVLRRWWMTRY